MYYTSCAISNPIGLVQYHFSLCNKTLYCTQQTAIYYNIPSLVQQYDSILLNIINQYGGCAADVHQDHVKK